jgi:hypothetical protein
MTIMRGAGPAVAVAVLLGLTACAERGGTGTGAPAPPSAEAAAEGLVLRVEHVGGFVSPSMVAGRLPMVSVYADGRVITEGPVAAIYPGPALPNLQVHELDHEAVQDLIDSALAAGVAETFDLGTPPVADAPSTRFTVVTTDETYVREVNALWETPEDSGLTAQQEEARKKLTGLLSSLTDQAAPTQPYESDAVAAVVSPWVDPGDGLPQAEQPWPGPALPGEPTGTLPDLTCAVATGDQAGTLVEAARSANAATPWTTPDGLRWSVTFRPLLPDESDCADLGD